MPELNRTITTVKTDTGHCGTFSAMASPCELLIETADKALAHQLTSVVAKEAWRIEQTYSRYTDTSQIHQINNSNGKPIKVDDELSRLLDFADQCHQISGGLFDITSGVLREIWQFDGSDKMPTRKQAKALKERIGWEKISWQAPYISVPTGMQIDLGGFGKEYAVDQAAQQLKSLTELPFLINFGGDLYANKPPTKSGSWKVGIEIPGASIESTGASIEPKLIPIVNGAIATSGDAKRFLLKNGVRYPHVLNPRTAWPVLNAPHSVTVVADSCIQAGFFATLAMLHGKEAQHFLDSQELNYTIF